MKLQHPMIWIPEVHRRRWFIGLVVVTVIVMIGLQAIDAGLKTDPSPGGIVSFEFAGTPKNASAMLAAWGTHGQIRAGLSLGLDYLFMFCYAAAIALGVAMTAKRLAPRGRMWETTGDLLAWGQIIAAALDAVENLALIYVLLGSTDPIWTLLAAVCAAIKFTLVALGLAFVFIGFPLSSIPVKSSLQ